MSEEEDAQPWQVDLGNGESFTAALDPAPEAPNGALFVCAHGAGGHMDDAGVRGAAQALRGCGVRVVRFNFPYRERKSPRPDPMPRLMECVAAAADRARREVAHRLLLLGGRSMGGRAASMLAAEGYPCDGLLLLAYPLHPAKQLHKLRTAHLARIAVPVLCVNGTRDALCDRDLMEAAIAGLPRWTMHWLQGADHSFRVPKSSGRTDREILAETAQACRSWLSGPGADAA